MAWTYPEPEGKVWTPPNTPLGSTGRPVKGHDAKPSGAKAPTKAADWKPEVAAPVVTGTATVVVGAGSAEAEAARKVTGGASPASGGQTGAKAGNLAVRVAPGTGTGESAHTVTVEVAGQDKGKAAGVSGPLISLKDAEAQAGGNGREAHVSLDLKALQAGGWSDRAQLIALPACSLMTPERPECRTQTPVTAKADSVGTVTADITLPPAAAPDNARTGAVKASYTTRQDAAVTPASSSAGSAGSPVVLTVASSPSGSMGNYTATSLSSSSAWTAGSNTGSFTYSYPIQLPPALGGAAPTVALGYNSADVDGKTSATNAQPSWVGDGWGFEPGFIERSYRGCDKAGITGSPDQCWGGQNASLSLGGHSGAIVRDDTTGSWHLESDDGTKVEQLTGAPKAAGDIDYQGMEYWRVTTPDGVQYYFGLNHLPGGDGSDPAANSVLTVPVYSPNSGDPCYSTGSGNNSWCQMAWRWQLDYVVDPHGNLTTYKYATEGNKYQRGRVQSGGVGTLADYQRAGYLKEIAYGQRLDEQTAAKGGAVPAAKVTFSVAERCIPSGSITCSEDQRTAANAGAWPDTPIDQICTDSSCTVSAPTFFTTKRLTTITTQVQTDSGPRVVDTWNLNQQLADPKDGTKQLLQLDSVQRVPSNGQAEIKDLPAVQFQYTMRANRVDGLVPASPMFMRPRLMGITTETGGSINVIYKDPECSRVNNRMPSSEDGNTMACIPVKWYLQGQSSPDPVNDWFDKPLVKVVTEQDLVSTPGVSKTTEYTYEGGAAWHRNDAEFTDPKTRTWDQFRGYQSVITTTGSGDASEAPKTQQRVTYLRGMTDDYLANSTQRTVQVPSPLGGTVTDSAQLAGRAVATEVFDKAGGTVTGVTGITYSGQQKSATHAQSAGAPKVYAWLPDAESTAITKARLADGSWRTTTAVTTTEPANGNRVVKVDDKGDGTAATPETCTTTGYATGDNPQMLTLASDTTTFQGSCSGTATSANTLAASRIIYDGKPLAKAGTVGDATSNQVLDHFDQAGNPVYVHNGSSTFDVYGRGLTTATTDGSTYDHSGAQITGPSVTPAVTTIALTPASGRLPTEIRTTGPLGAGWTTTVTQDPARGSPLTSKDINDRVTTSQYDALGRLTAVWAPDRPTAEFPSRKFTYALNGSKAPSAVTTESINDDALSYSASVEIYDGLGRPRQTQSTSDAKPTGRLITDTVYDSHGWVIKTSAPYYEQGSFPTQSIFLPAADGQVPGQTWNSYDGNGRVVRSEFRSNGNLQWATTTAYPGADRTDVTPPSGATPSSAVVDARGRATALWQYRTPTATGNPADADITAYGFTPTGLASSRTDGSGNTWSYTYDLRGRQISAADPDTGTTRTFYDVNSRVDHTVDARNNTVAFTYDLLGRKTGSFTGSVAPANQLAAWTYDTLVKGQNTSSTRYVGGASGAAYTNAVTGYDTAYRPLGTSITIPAVEKELAGTYTTANTYSPVIGSLKKLDIPAAGGLPAETVSYGRTITGLLTASASRGKAVIAQVAYDALARPVRTTAGDYGKQVVSTQQYDWGTGRVINSFLDRQTGTTSLDQTSYTYTPSGRITSVTDRQDAAATDTQCFTYDHLSRLTGAWTDTGGVSTTADWTDSSGTVHGTGSSTTVPGVGGCINKDGPATVSPGGRTVGGPAPYWNTYTYDATGNRTGLVQHDITGNSLNDTTTTQTFGAAKTTNTPTNAPNTGGGTGGPHALFTSTTSGPAGTKAVTYQYDAKGNTTAITDTGGTTTLTWNGEDKLDSLTKTGQAGATTYLYDADGNQLIRRNPGKTTLNLATDELTLDTASGSTSNVRSIAGPGGLTYTRVTAAVGGGTVLIQAADPHGTNGVQITGNTAQTVTRRPTDPFGNPRGTRPTASQWAGTKGFIGGSKDDTTGLTNLGARQYDPARGRFISPDPVLDQADPQQWNGYAYSNNNPVNLSDPSGLRPEGVCGGFGTCADYKGNITTETFKLERDGSWTEGYWNWYSGNRDHPNHVGNHYFILYRGGTYKAAFKQLADTLQYVPGLNAVGAVGSAVIDAHDGNYMSAAQNLAGLVPGERVAAKAAGIAGKAATAANAAEKIDQTINTACDITSLIQDAHSFLPGTQVLLADGTTRAIDNLQPGDQVTATDPETGTTQSKSVIRTIRTPDDEQFTDLTLQAHDSSASSGATESLTSTQHHPFWDETTHRWTNASDLRAGDDVRTADGGTLTVLTVRNYNAAPQAAYDLTIADLHTYYVLAGATPVLVHNCQGGQDASGAACSCPSPRPATWTIDAIQHPDSAIHAAEQGGEGMMVTLDRAGADARRTDNLRGIPTLPGQDRDEFPPAVFKEGASAHVKHIGAGDNRGAGSDMKNQLVGIPNGSRVRVTIMSLNYILGRN
ncbi:polymorphic toxin-type HINT domain-containing protein [Kitasatospora xanthocidica]|uniref:polymorphic toxin-type HINT domain-containing protein n=1 Tax=Kitasatospora xanthocidica TaxID=83382 RepID=UPI00167B0366|nr:polymorphic toxin-type HINT domain-containing protein [Kitasatospora xanthocidica]